MDNIFNNEQRLAELEKKVEELYKSKKELNSTPTYNPTHAGEQFAFYNGDLYVNINNVWKKASGGNYYMGWALEPASTSDVVITGVGFKPKMIKIRADISNAWSIGTTTSPTNNYCLNLYYDSSYTLQDISIEGSLIYLKYTDGTDRVRTNLKSFDDDGFTMSVATALDSYNIIYECYG